MTDLDAAPESLLKFVRCKCKLSSKILVAITHVLVVKMDSNVSQPVGSVEEKDVKMQKKSLLRWKKIMTLKEKFCFRTNYVTNTH